jgi:hypothetical protein
MANIVARTGFYLEREEEIWSSVEVNNQAKKDLAVRQAYVLLYL